MINFKWKHSASGTVSANTFHKLATTTRDSIPNLALAKSRGYMSTVRDWRNTELKIYFDAETGSNNLILYMGGEGISPCSGFAYEAFFSSDGTVGLQKRMYHGNVTPIKVINNGPLPAGMKGVALCRFNIHNNSAVRLECWVDKGTNGQWKRVLFVVDDGFTYGKNGSKCGGPDRIAGTFGFPIVGFKANFSYNYEKMSAREINAGGSFNEAQTAGGLARVSGGGSTPLPATADAA